MYRISIVSYINSLPYLLGLQESNLNIQLSEDIPSVCADKLMEDTVDIGLVPVGALSKIPHYEIISNYGICAFKKVNSVFVFSNTPIDLIKKIYLDSDSRTSNLLTKVLAKYHWKIEVQYASEKVIELKAGEAFVAIGDKTFNIIKNFKFAYDLASEWYSYCGLPFVFAVWASNKKIESKFNADLNKAFAKGLEARKKLIPELNKKYPKYDFEDYYYNCIQYTISADAHKALVKFLELSKHV